MELFETLRLAEKGTGFTERLRWVTRNCYDSFSSILQTPAPARATCERAGDINHTAEKYGSEDVKRVLREWKNTVQG
jgi:hypothetical protein